MNGLRAVFKIWQIRQFKISAVSLPYLFAGSGWGAGLAFQVGWNCVECGTPAALVWKVAAEVIFGHLPQNFFRYLAVSNAGKVCRQHVHAGWGLSGIRIAG